jgi:hypothetical protein
MLKVLAQPNASGPLRASSQGKATTHKKDDFWFSLKEHDLK